MTDDIAGSATPCPYHFHVGCVREGGCVCSPAENLTENESLAPEVSTWGKAITPKHGNGMLRPGSPPGGHPGAGRPKALVRQKALEVSETSIEWLKQVRDGEIKESYVTKWGGVIPIPARVGERIKAAEALNRMAGLEQEDAEEDSPTRRTLTVRIVHE